MEYQGSARNGGGGEGGGERYSARTHPSQQIFKDEVNGFSSTPDTSFVLRNGPTYLKNAGSES